MKLSRTDRLVASLILAAFLAGWGYGRYLVQIDQVPVQGATSLAPTRFDILTLSAPLGEVASPANGKLHIKVFASPDLNTPLLGEFRESPNFTLESPWLRALVDQRLAAPDSPFGATMCGKIRFVAPETRLHLKVDNGYRLRLRNARGEVQSVEDWSGDVIQDFSFLVRAEPGVYEIEIDYANFGGDANFRLWSDTSEIEFSAE